MEAIKKTLTPYPSSFNVEKSMVTLSRDEILKIKNKLTTEMDSSLNEFSTDMEKIRVENLLSYLYFKLGERNKAVEYNQKVLDISPDSMIALSNKAWYLLHDRKDMISCQKVCKHLKSLRTDKLSCLIAKAEVAFTYSRFGLKHYQKAVSEFENVIQECQKINEETGIASSSVDCNTRVRIPIEYRCVWMYGRALCQQRLSNVYNMHDICETEHLKINYKLTLDLFSKIIELNESTNECIKRYKARSFIEVGLIAYDVNKTKSVFPRGIAELLPEQSPLLMDTTQYFKTALLNFPEDVFVLERSGKYFRYANDVERSIHLLTNAIRIKPTSFGYHHLALSLIRLLEYNKGSLAHQLQSLPLEPEDAASKPLVKECTKLDMIKQPTNKAPEETDCSNVSITQSNGPANLNDNKQFTTMPQGQVHEKKQVACGRWCAAESGTHPVVTSFQTEKIGTDYERHRSGNYRPNYAFRNRKCFYHSEINVRNLDQEGNASSNSKANIYSTKETKNMDRRPFHYAQRAKSNFNLQSDESVVDTLTDTFSQTVLHQRKDNQTNVPQGEAGYRPSLWRRDPKAVNKYTPPSRFHRHERAKFNRSSRGHFQTTGRAFYPHFSNTKCKPGIKCPRDPIAINYKDNKVVVDTIIAHLDKASEMSSNTVALYDKAVLYRQIKQSENALEVLEQLMQNENELSSKVMLANIYEQAAFCINDLLKTDIYETAKREQMQVDRDFYLKSSIEISCNLVDKITYLHNCWKSAATLRDILYDNLEIKRSKKTLQELWFLYNKLHAHSEAIEILKELQYLAEDEEEKTEFIEGLIKHHLCLHNFEEAVIALCMSKQLRDGQTSIQNCLVIQVYIEAGLDAFRKKHYEKSRMRIREAFKYLGKHKTTLKNKAAALDDSEERFDLFILSNLNDEECGRKLMLLLNHLGLKTTFNTDSPAITPGTPEVIGMMDIMNKSNAFAILVDFDINDKQMLHITERIQKIVECRDYETLVVVITLPDTAEIPPTSTYSTYKRLCMSLTDDKPENEDDSFYENVKSLLISLASVSNDT